MKFIPAIAAAVVLCLASAAYGQAPKAVPAQKPATAKSANDPAVLEAYVRYLLLWNDQIKVKVSAPKPAPMAAFQEYTVTGSFGDVSIDETFYVSADGSRIVRGSVYDVAESPFKKEMSLLKNDLQPSMGTPGAPVVLVVFSDYQCAYCREEAKSMRANLLKTYPKEVRLYFKEFPLDQIHPWARTAAIAGRCVFRSNPAAFWDYHDWIFDKQQEITPDNLKAKFIEWAQSKSMDTLQLGRCFDARATEPDINRNVAEARALRVNSTPTVFINGRPLPGSLPWPQLKTVIDWELNRARTTGAEAEKCCEVTLPVPAPAKR